MTCNSQCLPLRVFREGSTEEGKCSKLVMTCKLHCCLRVLCQLAQEEDVILAETGIGKVRGPVKKFGEEGK